MKKFIVLAALAALIIPLACNRDNPEAKTVLPAPAKAQFAKKLVLAETDKTDIASIEFTESGYYILRTQKTKSSTHDYASDTYTCTGDLYTLKGFGTIEHKGNQLIISPLNGSPVTVTATEGDKLPTSEFYTTVCRSWKVVKTDVNMKVGSSDIGLRKDGCDLHEIATELNSHGAKLALTFDGFKVNRITFTASKTFEVNFANKEHFVGPYTLTESGVFSYTLDHIGNYFFNASADGTVSVVDPYDLGRTGYIWIKLNTKINSGGVPHEGHVILTLSPLD